MASPGGRAFSGLLSRDVHLIQVLGRRRTAEEHAVLSQRLLASGMLNPLARANEGEAVRERIAKQSDPMNLRHSAFSR